MGDVKKNTMQIVVLVCLMLSCAMVGYVIGQFSASSIDFNAVKNLLCEDGGQRTISVLTEYGNTTIICNSVGVVKSSYSMNEGIFGNGTVY